MARGELALECIIAKETACAEKLDIVDRSSRSLVSVQQLNM